jgi:hypothetical protein
MAPKKPLVDPVKKSNKFRLVVFEGDMSDGSVSEIAHALSAALRPTSPAVLRHLHNGKPAAQLIAPEQEVEDQVEEEEQATDVETGEESEEAPVQPAKPARPSRPKKYKQPELVDLDWTGTGGPTFKEFAKEKAPTGKNRKYLVAALWLKEYGGQPTVSADKMYSAFRTAGWSVAFADWDQPFRNLVQNDFMRRGANSGEYSITTVGEGLLEKPE